MICHDLRRVSPTVAPLQYTLTPAPIHRKLNRAEQAIFFVRSR
jgi:hypothetical protein